MKYCNNCAHPISFGAVEGDALPRFYCSNCHTIHYQNPRLIVGCLPIFDGKILLCRRNIEPRFGYWNAPGGFMENNENVEEGALREAMEEAGIDLEIIGLQSVFSVPRINQVHLHFLAKMKSPHFILTPESSEIRFFAVHEIPWNEIAFKSNEFLLKAYISDLEKGTHTLHLGSYESATY